MRKANRAILLTVSLFFVAFLSAGQPNLPLKYKNSKVYAGIEVGSKGVKFSLIEMGRNARSSGAFNQLKDSSVNTDFISFTESSFQATLDGLFGLYQTALNDYDIPSKRVFTVVSSGVGIQAQKEEKKEWITQLIDSFRTRISDDKREVPVIDVVGEARLSHLGIVPDARRYTTLLIDIGSGNTKGGFFPYGNLSEFKLFELTWGTKSTANATEKACGEDNTLDNYNRKMARVLAGAENNEIIYAVNSSGSYPLSDNIAFSGGISWALATLMYPEKYDESVVIVSYEDVVKFSERIYRDYKSLSPEALLKKLDDPVLDKELMAKNIKTVNKVFDQRAMMAGTGLLLKIMRQFSSIYESKRFYLVKNGQVGWISAYVDETVDN